MGTEKIKETIEKIIATVSVNKTSNIDYTIGYLNCLINTLDIIVSSSKDYITIEDFEEYQKQVSWLSQERDFYEDAI